MDTPLDMTRAEIDILTADIKMAEKMRETLNRNIHDLKLRRSRLRTREITLMTEDLEMQARVQEALVYP